ncbi:hypothetical protein DYB37_014070 [Aphanomyces astaci]|nr:hypothetical protein DYB34_012619 [Aphanomyces astaci]RHZ04637.1 hypothetical protein DYB31_012795 [Aphanomyces astaci]RHZ26825.1 hypothetical protein DYB37_014070 [Aphanomyces astaci]RHZ28935.1 hypothetical protein DYB26_004379 [Aphanomyces astaci]RLO12831.1 hypothetical protein DYB28_005613 [Aphanomyces astaci]
MLFMTLVTLKHAGTWDILSASFDEGAATFSNRINQFIRVLHPYLVRKYIDEQGMKTAPAVSFGEKKTYFSKKHGLYGHKVEGSVAPNDLAINVTNCAVGSTSDFEMFKANLGFHSTHLEKQPSDTNVSANDALRDKFPSQ